MSETIAPSTTVYTASFAALLGALTIGLALGYTAPAFYDIEHRSKSTNIFDKDNKKQVTSLIGSMLAVGAIAGSILVEPANKFLGRRLSLILMGFPFAIGWLFIGLAHNVTMMVIGRLLTGMCCGTVSGIAPTYVVEISPPQIRGTLGTCFQVMVTVGILIESALYFFLEWHWLAGINVSFALSMSALMYFMPETPQWLLGQRRNQEAEESLKRLRLGDIGAELNTFIQAATESCSSQEKVSITTMIKGVQFYKPFILALFLMFFQQFSGINAVLFFTNDLFEGNPPIGTLAVCIAQVIATIIGSALVDRLGRRMLLFASGFGHAVSLIAYGFVYPKEFGPAPAIVCIVIFISSFSIGFGPIPWMMIPELSSTRVRSIIATVATLFNWTCVYVITASVKPLIDVLGVNVTYWLFALICAMSCVFVGFFLPETKGKTSEQIQRELLGIPERTLQVNTGTGTASPHTGLKTQEGQSMQPFATA